MEQPPIGRYQILEAIAAGSQGTVYRAFAPESGQIVALKVLHPGLTADSNYLERFRREARIAASIDHPNVVKVFEVGEAGGQHFIAMEFLPESLARVIEASGSLLVERAKQIGLQIARGLAAAHKLGIVHRDVKPQNVLIGPDGEAKVTDFGIARAETFSTMTMAGMVMGTPHYMSPEQCAGSQADARSDVYSFGCLLYQMLTGGPPFRGTTPEEVLRRHREERPPSVRAQRKDISQELSSIVDRCLAKQPEQRYQSMSHVVAALGGGGSASTVKKAPINKPAGYQSGTPLDARPAATRAQTDYKQTSNTERRRIPADSREALPSAETGTDKILFSEKVNKEVQSLRRLGESARNYDAERSNASTKDELRSRALQHPTTILPLTVAALSAIYLLTFPAWISSLLAIAVLITSGLGGAVSFAWIYFVLHDDEHAKLVSEIEAKRGRRR